MDPVKDLLGQTADYAAQFLGTLDERPVRAEASADELLEALGGPLPEEGTEDAQLLAELIAGAEPGVVGTQTGRYFGFVTGSALPASVAADWLATVWDQNGFSVVTSPAAAAVEDVVAGWLAELLGLPEGVSSGFVTGAQGANTTALAAARQHVLAEAGWDVARDGVNGAPRIRVLAGGERHVTIDRSLRLLGLGTAALELVAADGQGRMRADTLREALRDAAGPTIVCAQAGNVNTGAFDPLAEIAEACEGAGAWLHVDGAFGLWAGASPRFRHLVDGVERADSWATDAHKWLNVPYDSGLVFCRHPDAQAEAMAVSASYLQRGGGRSPSDWVPESSRRARGSPSGRPCAPSAATGSRGWSTAAASTRAASPRCSARSPTSRSSTRSSSIRSSSASATTTIRLERWSAASRPTAPAGSARRTGRAGRRCGSRCRASGRRPRTSSGRRRRS